MSGFFFILTVLVSCAPIEPNAFSKGFEGDVATALSPVWAHRAGSAIPESRQHGVATAPPLLVGQGVAVHFKDGSLVAGVLAGLDRERVSVEFGGGTAGWSRADVARIEPRLTELEMLRRMEREAGSDRPGLMRALHFARFHGFFTEYRRLADALGISATEPARPPEFAVERPAPPGESVPVPAAPVTLIIQNYAQAPPAPVFGIFPAWSAPPRPAAELRAEREAFLSDLKARREAMRHRPTSALEEYQFRFQEALDRHAHGLPFSAAPF